MTQRIVQVAVRSFAVAPIHSGQDEPGQCFGLWVDESEIPIVCHAVESAFRQHLAKPLIEKLESETIYTGSIPACAVEQLEASIATLLTIRTKH
jgi:hypothetical protein